MKTHAEYDCMIPEYALSYLINADSSGLEDNDVKAIDNYMEQFYNEAKKANGHVVIDPSDEEGYFTYYPDFGAGCTVNDTKILILVQQ